MKTHLLTNQNARTIQIILYKLLKAYIQLGGVVAQLVKILPLTESPEFAFNPLSAEI